MEALERRIESLRAEVRRAMTAGDRDRARGLRAELRECESRWEESLARLEASAQPAEEPVAGSGSDGGSGGGRAGGAILPMREQVHQALMLLGGPAAPKLIVSVHDAFFAGRLPGSRLTSLRRDEERSFRSAPYARPYYICAALTAELLSPARGLLAVSTWPMERRIVGPLSPRVDFLTAAIRVAERFKAQDKDNSAASADSRRLLWRFAANIPRAAGSLSTMSPDEIIIAAREELTVHERADFGQRALAARRARAQLDDAGQLFGAGLQLSRRTSAGG